MKKAASLSPFIIDFKSIALLPEKSAPEIVLFSEADGFFLNRSFTDDFRIRRDILNRVKSAQKRLPAGYHFMIYEAFRPLQRQVTLWKKAEDYIQKAYPKLSTAEQRDLTETFVADPFNGIGSGHQAACAIDISLCDNTGKEYDMGTQCQEIHDHAPTNSAGISAEARRNRKILVDALEAEGMINYPSEWWHFSYGDHQWAFLLGKTEAFYGPLDI